MECSTSIESIATSETPTTKIEDEFCEDMDQFSDVGDRKVEDIHDTEFFAKGESHSRYV